MQKLVDVMPSRIRELRIERGWSLEELAERADTTFGTIWKLENSQRKLSLEWIDKLASAFNLSWADLVSSAPARSKGVRLVPLVGKIAAGNWREAIEDPIATVTTRAGGANSFALTPEGDSMNLLVPPGGWVVIDPDDFELKDGKAYAIMNGEGETTFKRFRADPPRLEPCSDNPEHKEIVLGREPFTVIGRAVEMGSSL